MDKGGTHLEVLQSISPLKGLEGVLVIDPGGHGAQHEAQPPREAACVILTQVKLNAVQGSLHSGTGEAALLQLLQLTQNQLLHLMPQSKSVAYVPNCKAGGSGTRSMVAPV